MIATVLGATGYSGALLLRLLIDHPAVTAIIPVSGSRAGQPLAEAVPGFAAPVAGAGSASAAASASGAAGAGLAATGPAAGPAVSAGAVADAGAVAATGPATGGAAGPDPKLGDGRLVGADEAAQQPTDVVFSALPPFASAAGAAPYFASAVVIDLAADFRIQDSDLFATAYGSAPPRPDLLPQAVYGLCEWHGAAIRSAPIIANPGCYPTAVLLPLLPLAAAGLLCGTVIAHAMSGITGAGRKVSADYLFTELSENVTAYAPGRSHRHYAEMIAQLGAVAPNLGLLFTPHLVPMRRGLAATVVATLRAPHLAGRVTDVLERCYAATPFVRLTGERIPATADVWGANRCDIGWRVAGDQLLLFSVIDNLVKGAAGQAVQNMNLRFGLAEAAGLPRHAQI